MIYLLAIACTVAVIVTLHHYLSPLLTATLRMVELYEDCQRRTKRATDNVEAIREEVGRVRHGRAN